MFIHFAIAALSTKVYSVWIPII